MTEKQVSRAEREYKNRLFQVTENVVSPQDTRSSSKWN